MSELVPNIIALDKGLDLQSPKITAPPGSVLDCLNYEQVDFQGQKRIDGYSRYDGSPLSAVPDFILVDPTTEGYTVNSSYTPYDLAFYSGALLGARVLTYSLGHSDYDVVAVINYTAIPEEATWGNQTNALSAQDHADLLLQVNSVLRSLVEELPGPISGLHWFNDRLYAVVDIESYEPDDTKINTDSNASLFESRSVQQVLEEDAPGPYDFGWRFVHQGWKVLFDSGISLYGNLPAINQNRQGVGIEGPTSIDLNNGAASILTQNVTISNGLPQVNGWKDSTTSNTYALNPAAIQYDDSSYIYADAYIQWDSTTGIVTGDTAILTEYSPTNTIEMS